MGRIPRSARFSEIEAAARIGYEQIAGEYYTSRHPTSNAFDAAIKAYIRTRQWKFLPHELYLEVGAGRSRLAEICEVPSATLIVADISLGMLRHSERLVHKATVYKLILSAFSLPFVDRAFLGVYSFLGDAFNTREYFLEAGRVLKREGQLVHIVPNYTWAATLRRELAIPSDKTFFLKDGKRVFVPSLVLPSEEIVRGLKDAGFRSAQAESLRLPRSYPVDELPEHITVPSGRLKVSPYDLDLLDVVTAKF